MDTVGFWVAIAVLSVLVVFSEYARYQEASAFRRERQVLLDRLMARNLTDLKDNGLIRRDPAPLSEKEREELEALREFKAQALDGIITS